MSSKILSNYKISLLINSETKEESLSNGQGKFARDQRKATMDGESHCPEFSQHTVGEI